MARPRKPPTPIGDFPINAKTKNALNKAGIQNSDDFANFTVKDLGDVEGIGPVLWLELKTYLQGSKIKWKKREPKEKKAPKWDPETKDIMLYVLDGQVSNFAGEMKNVGMLIEKYGAETIRNSKIPEKIQPPTFRYFFTGGRIAAWCDNYFRQFATVRLLEDPVARREDVVGSEEPIGVSNAPEVAYVPKEKAPSSLADFLKFRK